MLFPERINPDGSKSIDHSKFRKWPYGTVKNVRVLYYHPANAAIKYSMLVVEDLTKVPGGAGREAYMLVGHETKEDGGSYGTITFRAGGPTGGYWEFRRDNPAPASGQ